MAYVALNCIDLFPGGEAARASAGKQLDYCRSWELGRSPLYSYLRDVWIAKSLLDILCRATAKMTCSILTTKLGKKKRFKSVATGKQHYQGVRDYKLRFSTAN